MESCVLFFLNFSKKLALKTENIYFWKKCIMYVCKKLQYSDVQSLFRSKKMRVFGSFGLILALSLILTGCPANDDNADNKGNGKYLVITGLDFTGDVSVILANKIANADETPAGGSGAISGNKVSIELKAINRTGDDADYSDDLWTGEGSWYVWLCKGASYTKFEYSTKTQQVFSSKSTSIPWSDFSPAESFKKP
jgi:hypothetical protein